MCTSSSCFGSFHSSWLNCWFLLPYACAACMAMSLLIYVLITNRISTSSNWTQAYTKKNYTRSPVSNNMINWVDSRWNLRRFNINRTIYRQYILNFKLLIKMPNYLFLQTFEFRENATIATLFDAATFLHQKFTEYWIKLYTSKSFHLKYQFIE